MTNSKKNDFRSDVANGPSDQNYKLPTDTEITQYARLSADHGADAIACLDPDLRVLWLNPGFERLTGYGLEEMLGRRPGEFLYSELTEAGSKERFERQCRSNRPFVTENQFRHRDGHDYWLENCVTPIFDENASLRFLLCNARETTVRRQLRSKHEKSILIEKSRQRERRLLSQISEWLYSAKSLDELTQVVSRSLETLIPEASGQLHVYSNSRDVLDLLVRWNGGEHQTHIDPDDCWSLRRGRAYSYGLKSIEFPCHHADKRGLPYFCLPIVAHGQTNGLLHLQFKPDAIGNMAKEQKFEFLQQRWQLALLCAEQISLSMANVQLRQELLDQSVRDPLTNLWNRRWLLDAAHKEIQNSNRKNVPFSILSLDIDHFKKFNDHHGHDAGDLVLRAIGNEMLEYFATDAAPCRIGGEEFLVLCPGLNSKEAGYLADQFRKEISNLEVKHSGTPLPKVTVSIGVASYPRDALTLVDLMSVADRAMYQAKDCGRDQITVYESEPAPRHGSGLGS